MFDVDTALGCCDDDAEADVASERWDDVSTDGRILFDAPMLLRVRQVCAACSRSFAMAWDI